jgi:excisionase family DNA binding protein
VRAGKLYAKDQIGTLNAMESTPGRLLKVPEVAARLGLGVTKVWEMIAAGEITSLKLGDGPTAPRRVSERALNAYIDRLEAQGPDAS